MKKNVFQRLTDVVIGAGNGMQSNINKTPSIYDIPVDKDKVLYTFNTPEERDAKLMQLKQEKLLSYQWKKAAFDGTSLKALSGNQVKVMYRDADLMDAWPEIGAALDILAEESTTLNPKGKMINITSKSDRIIAVLEDLFINRLDIHITLPMIFRSTYKYGNDFMLLNIDSANGIMGWRELPVYEMERLENGVQSAYGSAGAYNIGQLYNLKPDEVKFIWVGHNEATPYKNWQVAHFRMIKDSRFLPYGMSYLNKARRHWRMLSMMEDAMLLSRLERSIERRIFKVNVGLIDDQDVPAYLQTFADNIKRAPIIDPQTGQIDLRKNFLDVSADFFIPVRNGQDPSDISVLQGSQTNMVLDDINYMQNKILSALKIPKTFLNFSEAQGKGQNLSIADIRFNRAINSGQQSILMELYKIAIIHLYLLGFEDDLTNFSITLNNPSNQIEALELANMAQRMNVASQALAQQGDGLPLMSWHQVQRDIMGKTDNEISDILNEIRLEAALANELQLTPQIIKRTGLFDKVDNIYGEIGAQYQEGNPQGGPGDGPTGGGPGGGPMGGPIGGFGDDFGDMDDFSGDSLGDVGEPGAMDSGSVTGEPGGGGLESLQENKLNKLQFFNSYLRNVDKTKEERISNMLLEESTKLNNKMNSIVDSIDKKLSAES